jgi:zinc/manganese transport system substrate-binding protein
MRTKSPILALLTLALCAGSGVAKVRVAASITDLASIASYVGGDRVDAFSIARGYDDPHNVEVLPSYMVKVSRADLYLKVGLGLDQWANLIVDGTRNAKVKMVDCSGQVQVLEKPTGRVSAEQGDVHPEGNPHYWLDPAAGVAAARVIAKALTNADPDGAALFAQNLDRFAAEAEQRMAGWKKQIGQGAPIITYHKSWEYLEAAFGLELVGNVEPVPGIPPTAAHLKDLVDVIKSRGVKLIIQEPYFPDDAGQFLQRETGVKVLTLWPSCKGTASGDYFQHLDDLVNQIAAVI